MLQRLGHLFFINLCFISVFLALPALATSPASSPSTQANLITDTLKPKQIGGEKQNSITGTVTNITGHPLANIKVSLYGQENPFQWKVVQSNTTNALGQYEFTFITPGNYRLGFRDENNQAYIEEYYNNGVDFNKATTVTVASGQAQIINVSLDTFNQIKGTLHPINSTMPLTGIKINLYQWLTPTNQGGGQGQPTWQLVKFTDSGNDGSYLLDKLGAGSYRVEFSDPTGSYLSEFYNDASSLDKAQDITFANGNLVTADAQLAIAAHLRGIVTGNNTPLAGVNVQMFYYNETTAQWQTDGRPPYFIFTNGNGEYAFKGLKAGKYRLGFYPTVDTYVKEFYNDVASFDRATDITVTDGLTTTIHVVLKSATQTTVYLPLVVK